MTKIDWTPFGKEDTEINLGCNKITEMNWDSCPPGLIKINLRYNKITCI